MLMLLLINLPKLDQGGSILFEIFLLKNYSLRIKSARPKTSRQSKKRDPESKSVSRSEMYPESRGLVPK